MMDMDPAAIGATVTEMLLAERFGETEQLFAPMLREAVSADTLGVAWRGEIAKIGTISEVGAPFSEPSRPGSTRVGVAITGTRGGLQVVMSVDKAGQLNGFRLAPPEASWTGPKYAYPKRFTEHEVIVCPGALAVSGTVTLPHGRGPRPGVVLLSSGPADRDLSSGPNKPLKDVAWGLASRGIAVLRFDKVTHTHGEITLDPGFTMVDEYVPHTVAAVRLLQQQPAVDPSRVFVVGHSGGGKAAPRVAAAEPSVAGVVILAGDTVPLSRSVVRVAHYLADMDPGADVADSVDALKRQAALVEGPDLSPATLASELLFGWPASYWLDLRGYDPAETAAALGKPVLVLQGGRDYQVTVADDLPRWRKALADRPDATIRVIEADDHMFFRGFGPSKPADYHVPRHVDPAVITAITDWLLPNSGRSRLPRLFRRAH